MMRIGVIVDNDLNADIRVLRELKVLKEQGCVVYVLCFGYKAEYPNLNNEIEVDRIHISRKLKNLIFFFFNTLPIYEWFWTFHIKRFISIRSVEILHVHDLYMSKSAHNGIMKSGKKIPLILDLHENYSYSVKTYKWTKGYLRNFFSKPDKWLIKEGEYLKYADRIIVLSKEFAYELCKKHNFLKEVNFTIYPNVPDLSLIKDNRIQEIKNLFNNNYPILLYYGIIAERRGIFESLQIFNRLVIEGYKVNFLLIGPIDKQDKKKFLKMTGHYISNGRIQYIPWINSQDFYSYLKLSDICLAPFHKNPQHESGVANKVFEYMQGGKPIIASDCKPQKELIEEYDCGIIFKNSDEFYEAAVTLLVNKALREKMGANGKQAILERFNSEILKNRLVNLYKSLFH